MPFSIRDVQPERDYGSLAELARAVDPESNLTAEILRYRDQTHEPHIRRTWLIAEDATSGAVRAMGRVGHSWWAFHPRRYQLRIEVHPDVRRQGLGTALHERLDAQLRAWDAELVRAEAEAGNTTAIAFLQAHGYTEWRRRWHSRLTVASADTSSLETAAARATAAGITTITYAEGLARHGDGFAETVYVAECLFTPDVPDRDRDSAMMTFERYRNSQLDSPWALHDAHFLALAADGQIVGLSRLSVDSHDSGVLGQDLTGTHRDYRGRGVAQALKLRTIEFARAHGYREISTTNDTLNAPMVHINDAIGFVRGEPTIVFERRLG
jgi:mycothiol synthase